MEETKKIILSFSLTEDERRWEARTESAPAQPDKRIRTGRERSGSSWRACNFLLCLLLRGLALFRSQNEKYKIFVNRLHGVLNVVKKINCITQMDCKSRDESNEPNYNVIRH